MSTTPEGKVKDKIKKMLKSEFPDAWYFWPRGTMMGRSGIPDLIICRKGRLLGVEVKAGKNTPTPLQLKELNGITKAGGIGMWVNENSLEELRQALLAV